MFHKKVIPTDFVPQNICSIGLLFHKISVSIYFCSDGLLFHEYLFHKTLVPRLEQTFFGTNIRGTKCIGINGLRKKSPWEQMFYGTKVLRNKYFVEQKVVI